MKGHVKRVFADKGFGFIKGEDGVDYFVHHSAMRGARLDELSANAPVTFQPGQGDKGPRAEDVELA